MSSRNHIFLGVLLSQLLIWVCPTLASAQPSPKTIVILRDLSIIRDVAIESFDDTGVVLSDKTRLGWDKILKASVAVPDQVAFDQKLKSVGLPIYRLKTRISNGDWQGAAEIAQPILENENGWSGLAPDVLYLSSLAMMKSHLLTEARGPAVWAFLVAASEQAEASEEALKLAGTNRLSDRECRLMISKTILPVWLDPNLDRAVISRLKTYAHSNSKLALGVTIYLTSMHIETGNVAEAKKWLDTLDQQGENEIQAWRTILKARMEQRKGNHSQAKKSLESLLHDRSERDAVAFEGPRCVALYYSGLTGLLEKNISDIDRARATLTLLKIPAIYGDTHKSLAAAALFQSAEIAELRGRDGDAQKLRAQLLRRYPRTYHGSLKLRNNN